MVTAPERWFDARTAAQHLGRWEGALGQRGIELAAGTFTWALLDQPCRINVRLDTRSCAELASLYGILTGAAPDPLPPCPYAQPGDSP